MLFFFSFVLSSARCKPIPLTFRGIKQVSIFVTPVIPFASLDSTCSIRSNISSIGSQIQCHRFVLFVILLPDVIYDFIPKVGNPKDLHIFPTKYRNSLVDVSFPSEIEDGFQGKDRSFETTTTAFPTETAREILIKDNSSHVCYCQQHPLRSAVN